MNKVDKNVVKPPNQEHPGDRRSNAYLPLAGASAEDICFINRPPMSRELAGTVPVTFQVSTIKPPDHRFHVAEDVVSDVGCTVEPGHGMIAVEPSDSRTGIVDVAFAKSISPNRA